MTDLRERLENALREAYRTGRETEEAVRLGLSANGIVTEDEAVAHLMRELGQ